MDLLQYLIVKFPDFNHADSAVQLIEIKEKIESSDKPDNDLIQYLRAKYVYHILPSLVSEYSNFELTDDIIEVYFFNALKDFITAFIFNKSGKVRKLNF